MAELPNISDAEWVVMEALWGARGALTAGEVVEGLAGKATWSPRTVKTLLGRLVKKGAVAFEAEGKRYLYRAAVSREACVRREGRSFARRVFGGEAGAMLVHFVKTAKLSAAEVEELRRVLEGKEK